VIHNTLRDVALSQSDTSLPAAAIGVNAGNARAPIAIDITVQDNTIVRTGRNGIDLNLTQHAVVTGNHLTQAANVGIRLRRTEDGAIIQNNFIDGSRRGISADGALNGAVIEGNTISRFGGEMARGVVGGGIVMTGDAVGTRISRNQVMSPQGPGAGISIYGARATGIQITDNAVEQGGGAKAIDYRGSNAVIRGNHRPN
jgi:hypothetical protein